MNVSSVPAARTPEAQEVTIRNRDAQNDQDGDDSVVASQPGTVNGSGQTIGTLINAVA